MDNFVRALDSPRKSKIWIVSNPILAQKKAFEYLGDDAILYLSNRENKKYAIFDPVEKKMVHFGDINYSDYTRHRDPVRRRLYLNRASNIKGDWRNNSYSSNCLSLNILW
jgi:hypothetical protein